MDYAKFIKEVKVRMNTDSEEEALKAIKAVFESLSEHLAGEEPRHLAAQLPPDIGKYLKSPGGASSFSVDDFFRKVGEKANVDKKTAVQHVRSVMEVLRMAVSRGELEDVKSQLPKELYEVLNINHQ
jgi:uncharacterized protein (DUF2267 family)